ncbi:MAG: S41 family peptidase [Planctomycetes bacterium]|nr:S41 family peptidase [Planctomycetota bacterium]
MKQKILVVLFTVSLLAIVPAVYLLSQEPDPAIVSKVEEIKAKLIAAENPDGRSDAAALVREIDGSADSVVEVLRSASRGAPTKVKAYFARERFLLGDRTAAIGDLVDVVATETAAGAPADTVKMESAVMLARVCAGFRDVLRAPLRRMIVDRPINDVELKIVLCLALWKSSQDTAAIDELKKYLDSSNSRYANLSAMMLAEIGYLDNDKVRDILSRLKNEPTDRGALAQQLLKRDRQELRIFVENYQASGRDPDELDVNTSVLDVVMREIGLKYVHEDLTARARLERESAIYMARALDPYSEFLDAAIKSEIEASANKEGWLGVSVGIKGARYLLLQVTPGSPADLAGLRPLDLINKISTVPDRDFPNLSLRQVGAALHGIVGEQITLTIFRVEWMRSREITLTFVRQEQPEAKSSELPGGLLLFAPGSISKENADALKSKIETETRGVILDLRHVIAGDVEGVVAFADLFIGKEIRVASSFGRNDEVCPDEKFDTKDDAAFAGKVVCLIDADTANAAEMLAAAISENGRGKAVGIRTFGLSIIQREFPMNSEAGSSLRLTIGSYFTPKGTEIFDNGVAPDFEQAPRIWRDGIYELVDEIRKKNLHREYYASLGEENQPKLLEVLKQEGVGSLDPANYPGFDEWLRGTGILPESFYREDVSDELAQSILKDRWCVLLLVRKLLRHELLGALWYDLADDLILARGIVIILGELGETVDGFAEYRHYPRALETYKMTRNFIMETRHH